MTSGEPTPLLPSHHPETLRGARIIPFAAALARHNRHPLTGLYDRAELEERLPKIIGSHSGKIGLFVLDVNELKKLNDTMGHDAGNQLLLTVASVLRRKSQGASGHEPRETDEVFHTGGDEFVFVGYGINTEEKLKAMNQRIVDELQKAGVSVAVDGVIHEPGETSDELIARADKKMITTKLMSLIDGLTREQALTAVDIWALATEAELDLRALPNIIAAIKMLLEMREGEGSI